MVWGCRDGTCFKFKRYLFHFCSVLYLCVILSLFLCVTCALSTTGHLVLNSEIYALAPNDAQLASQSAVFESSKTLICFGQLSPFLYKHFGFVCFCTRVFMTELNPAIYIPTFRRLHPEIMSAPKG